MQIKAKIKVAVNWIGMSQAERKIYLWEQVIPVANKILSNEISKRTIRNKNGDTTHIEVKI